MVSIKFVKYNTETALVAEYLEMHVLTLNI